MNYTVYFEIFGKLLKTKIGAKSEEDAKYKIMGKIKWHKFEIAPIQDDEMFESLKDLFGMK